MRYTAYLNNRKQWFWTKKLWISKTKISKKNLKSLNQIMKLYLKNPE